MTIWLPDISSHTGPRYQALADAIAAAIQSGELAVGAKLPPQREMAWRLGVTVGTVGRAYMLVERQGLVSGEVGRGTYVQSQSGREKPATLNPADPNVIDITKNTPATGPHPGAFTETLQEIAAGPDLGLLDYMPAQGPARHRAAFARWVERTGFQAEPDQVVVTCGAQQALSASLTAMARPGETVLVEEMTYCGLMEAAEAHGLQLVGVPMDEHGIRPEAVAEIAPGVGARVLAINPTFQNPTTAVMPEERRRELAGVARSLDLTMIEDDVYGYLTDDRPSPVAKFAPERTIYVTSASKCLAPGLRVGWAVCPQRHVAAMAGAIHDLAVTQPALTGQVVASWIEQGTAERLVRWQAQENEARHRLATEILDGLNFRSHPSCIHLFLTLPEHWPSDVFAATARERGVVVATAREFAVDPSNAPEAVRLCLGSPRDLEDLSVVLKTIRDLMLEAPQRRRKVI